MMNYDSFYSTPTTQLINQNARPVPPSCCFTCLVSNSLFVQWWPSECFVLMLARCECLLWMACCEWHAMFRLLACVAWNPITVVIGASGEVPQLLMLVAACRRAILQRTTWSVCFLTKPKPLSGFRFVKKLHLWFHRFLLIANEYDWCTITRCMID